jgi:hypothetical protein
VSTSEFVAVDMYAARLVVLLVCWDCGIVIEMVDEAVVMFGEEIETLGGVVTSRKAQPLARRATPTTRSLPFIGRLGERHGC